MQVQETADSNIWMWIAGAAVTAWNGLLSFILLGHRGDIKDLHKGIKATGKEREDHCIPRAECERTHAALNVRVDRLEDELKAEIKEGTKSIHKRLDKIYGSEKEK